MNADLEKLQESNKTELERRGSIINTGAPVTEAITIRDHIAVGFGDGTVRFFQSGSEPKVVKAHKGVVFSMARNGDYVLTGGAILNWWIVPIMLSVGFLTPWPYNYWRLKKYNQTCH